MRIDGRNVILRLASKIEPPTLAEAHDTWLVSD
jgi:hypothetical protein